MINRDDHSFFVEILFSNNLSDEKKLLLISTLKANDPEKFNTNVKLEEPISLLVQNKNNNSEHLRTFPFFINTLFYKKEFFETLIDERLMSINYLDKPKQISAIVQFFFTENNVKNMFTQDNVKHSTLDLFKKFHQKYQLDLSGELKYNIFDKTSFYNAVLGDNVLELSIKNKTPDFTQYILSLKEYDFKIKKNEANKRFYQSLFYTSKNQNSFDNLHFHLLNKENFDPNCSMLIFTTKEMFDKVRTENSAYDRDKMSTIFSKLLKTPYELLNHQQNIIDKLEHFNADIFTPENLAPLYKTKNNLSLLIIGIEKYILKNSFNNNIQHHVKKRI